MVPVCPSNVVERSPDRLNQVPAVVRDGARNLVERIPAAVARGRVCQGLDRVVNACRGCAHGRDRSHDWSPIDIVEPACVGRHALGQLRRCLVVAGHVRARRRRPCPRLVGGLDRDGLAVRELGPGQRLEGRLGRDDQIPGSPAPAARGRDRRHVVGRIVGHREPGPEVEGGSARERVPERAQLAPDQEVQPRGSGHYGVTELDRDSHAPTAELKMNDTSYISPVTDRMATPLNVILNVGSRFTQRMTSPELAPVIPRA